MKSIFKEIEAERKAQDAVWGEQNHPCLYQPVVNDDQMDDFEKQSILTELVYGITTEYNAKLVCKDVFSRGVGTYAHIAVEEMSKVISALNIHDRRKELVQLTAVCVAWIEKIDRDIKKLKA